MDAGSNPAVSVLINVKRRRRMKKVLEDKLCSCCRIRKPKSEFYGKTVKTGDCKPCQTKRQNDRRQFVVDYLKSHPCVDCGESHLAVLDFDHLTDKKSSISRLVRMNISFEAILVEISKCEVRCANCHRKRTAKQFNWIYRSQ